MNTDFQTLLEFLDRCGPEVTGRGLMPPTTEEAARLERLAAGQCDAQEREEICAMLQLHPAWLRWLADRVKMARKATGSGSEQVPA